MWDFAKGAFWALYVAAVAGFATFIILYFTRN